jgi:hypothetical protein
VINFFLTKIYRNIKLIRTTDKSAKKGPDTNDKGSIIIKKFDKENKALSTLSIFFILDLKLNYLRYFYLQNLPPLCS